MQDRSVQDSRPEQPKRLRRLARPLLARRGMGPGEADGWPLTAREQRRIVRKFRAARRIALVAIWTLVAVPIQATLILLPGRGKVDFARFYWAMVTRLLGVRVRVIGALATEAAGSGRAVVFASNHSSWLDIPVLGGRLPACFVAKDEVGSWPAISTIARLGRTIFVSRKRGRTSAERDEMLGRLAAGDNILLFPEGTSSDGSRVLPFRSSFFSIVSTARSAAADGQPPGAKGALLQPVSIVYDRMGWLPTGRPTHTVFAWYGDMNLATHCWRLAQLRGKRATILLHRPIDPTTFPDRKALSQAVWTAVADGAATLRQNRPAKPLSPIPAAGGSVAERPEEAYA